MILRKHFSMYCALVVLLTLYTTTAIAQDDQQIEYKPVLKLTVAEETETLPEGWQVVVGNASPGSAIADSLLWRIEEDGSGIAFMPQTQPVSLASPVLSLEDSCSAVSGVVLGSGNNKVEAQIRWMSNGVVEDTVPLREPPISKEANRRFNLAETERPENVDAVQYLVTVHPDDTGSIFRCTTANLTGAFSSVRSLSVLTNNIGYDQIGPKTFTVRANFIAQRATFVLADALGNPVFNDELSTATTIQSPNGSVWEDYYYRGDFSFFEEEGEYTITVELDQHEPVSVPVQIGFNLLWHKALAPVLAPFKRLRIEAAEATDRLTLWDPDMAGDATDATLLWDLVRSWSILRGRFYDTPAFVPLNEEVLYGLEKVAKWVLARGHADGEDITQDTYYATSLACGARYHRESDTILEAAKVLAEKTVNRNLEGALPFSVVMDMYELTKDDRYFEYAQRIFPGISVNRIEPLLDYEGYANQAVTIECINMFSKLAVKILKNAENPFGLSQAISQGKSGFFLWDANAREPLKGNTTSILAAVEIMAQAYRYTGGLESRNFVYDQLNWIMGNNPYGVCLVAGLCSPDTPPVFLAESWTPADAQGFVLNGIGPREETVDTPQFSLTQDDVNENTNGFSLYNNARYISAIAYLKRIPVARSRNASL